MKKLFYLVGLTLAFTTSVMAADLPCKQMSKDISFKSDKEMDQCVTQSDKVLNATYKHITSKKNACH
ncbi:hypothetical protein [Thiothrix lacustris]|uniref:hypothetical protein n=1 Tax=Thiothrix lacustris TaxID=525917 RepID=UPI0027E46A4E|nr:hypothetical protein [Thiothrix lacustris]WMP16045.1 hypothetical protein RCS87_11645 [Thiothrix lacustris]